ncbi:MAG: DNA-binding response regulator [Chromatiaceae bacterium]|nr:MAG: DNA-binding response regulator [Chromatiaceae bacterium]
MRILIVEDEVILRRQLATRISAAGYGVQETGDGHEGLYLAGEYPFDAAIIDLGLPGLSGLDLIRRLRAQGSLLPILVLTARDRWQDRVAGLEAGADDYLGKPFQPEELAARLRALLRRAARSATALLVCGPLRIDTDARQVWMEGRAVELTAYEYRLLEHLARQRPRVVSKLQLTDHLYAEADERDSNVVEVLVGRLRRKLDPNGRLHPIETRRGQGYRLTLDGGGQDAQTA